MLIFTKDTIIVLKYLIALKKTFLFYLFTIDNYRKVSVFSLTDLFMKIFLNSKYSFKIQYKRTNVIL